MLSKADLHLHTTYSDGTATVRELLAHVAQSDLKVIAITDHNTIVGAQEAARLAPEYGIEVIVGEEVSTQAGHLLALFVEAHLEPGRPLGETIAAARAQGALLIAPHPFGWLVPSIGRLGVSRRFSDPGWANLVDAVEIFNAGLWAPRSNALAAEFAAAHGLPVVGGSDSHHLPTVGLGYTLFPGRNAADLRRAIESGQTQADGVQWGMPRVAEVGALWARRSLGLTPPTHS
ncbi:PHP domain-containing protein [Candidatus Oscillochloris fontis]|uniref:PHP domain-containing protein n=1 Tax=Candidatus Oscillochloris fontis TaxID=2496868 RepID=UPI00101C65BE|nr:PHP domain-containing protein [Candidatus Oscillochloris fontis]